MAISVNGDGCRYCQPQEYIDKLSEWLEESRAEVMAYEEKIAAHSAEPVQGEAVEVVAYGDTDQLAALNKESSASCAVWNRPGRNRTALMTVAQHNRIMAAASAKQGEAAFSPSSKPVAWINSYTLAESATKKFGSYYLSPTRSDEDDTPLYTSPAKPDAELVELLSSCRGIVAREVERWNQVAARLLDKGAVESDLLKRIDAKLAEVNKQ
jgi:hypothetical protein